jgi:TetR/AcrR family transcriptional regulator, transcriptional repressor for nem operon
MKVSREQVQRNREQILAAAARLFRERGFEGVSVAEVMQAAGLTHGAFYGHFESKEALMREALAHWGASAPAAAAAARGKRAETQSVKDFADSYLSTRHRDNPGGGCAVAGLGAEAARGSAELRATLTETVKREIERFSAASPGKTATQRRRAALTSYATMVGAIVIARVVDDEKLSQEILATTRKSIRFD